MMERILQGNCPAMSPFPAQPAASMVQLSGLHRRRHFPDTPQTISLDAKQLACGVAVLGVQRSGKTNVISEMLAQQLDALQTGEKLIVLDVKGEYFDAFGVPADLRLGIQETCRCWNLFADILAWGTDSDTVQIHADQLCAALYEGQRSEMSPFFVSAARIITSCVIQYMIRHASETGDFHSLHNAALREWLLAASVQDYIHLFEEYEDFQSARNYLTANGMKLTREGTSILSEIDIMVHQRLAGAFGKKGDFSIIRWLQDKKAGGVLFLDSNPEVAEIVNPILAFLINESISALAAAQMHHPPRTAFFLDEFAQLPKLDQLRLHMSLLPARNVSVVLGLQDICQMDQTYTPETARGMLNLCQTVICLRASEDTIRYVQGRVGEVLAEQTFTLPNGSAQTQLTRRQGVDTYEILNLAVGEAFYLRGCGGCQFQFDCYG